MLTQLHFIVLQPPPTRCAPRRSLTLALLAPTRSAHVRAPTHTDAPRAVVAARPPGPSRTSGDGKVVQTETEPCADDADQAAEEDVEAEVAKIREACTGDVDGCADGDENQDEGVDWGRGVLVAQGDDVLVGVLVGWRGHGVLLVAGKDVVFADVGGGDGGVVGGIKAEGSGWEEGDCDAEFRGEEEGEVEEAGPGDCIIRLVYVVESGCQVFRTYSWSGR